MTNRGTSIRDDNAQLFFALYFWLPPPPHAVLCFPSCVGEWKRDEKIAIFLVKIVISLAFYRLPYEELFK